MHLFPKTNTQKLQEQQDIIYRYIRAVEKSPELEEYFDIYLNLMGKYAGDVKSQLLLATIFAKYTMTFLSEATEDHTSEQISEMQAAAKRMLLGVRDGMPYGYEGGI